MKWNFVVEKGSILQQVIRRLPSNAAVHVWATWRGNCCHARQPLVVVSELRQSDLGERWDACYLVRFGLNSLGKGT